MKEKNSIKILLASATMLLMAFPAFAQKFKVAKVERTRILVDKNGMLSLMLRLQGFLPLIRARWIASWALWWVASLMI